MIILGVSIGLLLAVGVLLRLVVGRRDSGGAPTDSRYGDDRDWARIRDELRAAGQRARA